MELRLNLGAYLNRHGISAYRLAKAAEGRVTSNTVYALARKPAQRVDLNTVGNVLEVLGGLTGEQVKLEDLLEVVDASQVIQLTEPSDDAQARAEALLIRPAAPGKPRGSQHPAEVSG